MGVLVDCKLLLGLRVASLYIEGLPDMCPLYYRPADSTSLPQIIKE